MKRILSATLVMLVILLFGSAQAETRVVLCMSNMDNARSVAIAQSVETSLENAGMELSIMDAEHVLHNQVNDIRTSIAGQPDYILIDAVHAVGLGKILQEAAKAGIKIILIEQQSTDVPEDIILSRIGMDYEWAGAECARVLAAYYPKTEAKIIEIQGEAGSSSTNSISRGFRDALCQYDNLQLAGVLTEGSSRESVESALLNFIKKKGIHSYDAVFGHNDEAGLGAVNAFLSMNSAGVPIISIGGQDDAIRALAAGKLYACITVTPEYGQLVLDTIDADLNGEIPPRQQLLQGEVLYANGEVHQKGY